MISETGLKVLIIELCEIYAAGLGIIIQKTFPFSDIHVIPNGDLKLIPDHPDAWDLIILGSSLQDEPVYMAALEFLYKWKNRKPLIFIPDHISHKAVKRIFERYLADGILLRNCREAELVQAIEKVLEGDVFQGTDVHMYKSTMMPERATKKDHPLYLIQNLTAREKEIMHMVIKGRSSVIIGETLYISPFTVKTHRKNMMKKLGVNNTLELIYYLEGLQYKP